MAEARLVFDHVFEGLLKHAVGARMTPALKAKLLAAGVDVDQKLKSSYPVEAWLGSVDACCAELFPGLSKDEQLFKLGTDMVAGFGRTLIGGAMFKMAKMLGPRRVMERMPANFRGGNNFTDARMTAKGPRQYEMWMNEVGESAPFIQASLLATLKLAGAKDPKVESAPAEPPPAATFHITWSE